MKIRVTQMLAAVLAVAAACVYAAGSDRATVPGNDPLYEIPFEYELDKIIVPVTVNGSKPIRCILDTGMVGGVFLMNPAVAEGMKLEYTPAQVMLQGAGPGTAPAKMATGASVDMAGVPFADQRVIVMGEAGPLAWTGWDGAIGASVFGKYVVSIDTDKKVIRLYDPGKFDPKAAGEAVEMTVVNTKPFIKVNVDVDGKKPVPLTAVVDTGSSSEIMLSGDKGLPEPAASVEGVLGRGVGGEVRGRVGRSAKISIGNFALNSVVSQFHVGRVPTNSDALIGMGLLNRFSVTFDYTNGRMYLKAGERHKEPFEFNMTGMAVSPEADGALRVVDVFDGSPAHEAGIRKGDLILTVDGRQMTFIEYNTLMESMRKPGKEVKIEYGREGKTVSASLKTRRLI